MLMSKFKYCGFHAGLPYSQRLARDTDRDYYLTAEEAVDYGLIDSVMEPDAEGADSAST